MIVRRNTEEITGKKHFVILVQIHQIYMFLFLIEYFNFAEDPKNPDQKDINQITQTCSMMYLQEQ